MTDLGPHSAVPEVQYLRMKDVDKWHQAVCSTFSRTRYKPGKETKFRAELSAISHGYARMARVQSGSGTFSRDANMIRRDSFDGLMVLMSLQGSLNLSQGEQHLQVKQGEALVYRHGCPFTLDIPEKYMATSLWVKPDLMVRHCPTVSENKPFVLTNNTVNGRLALAMVQELCQSSITRQATDLAQLVGATLDVAATNAAQSQGTELRRNDALIAKLSDYVRANIDDTEISLDTLVAVSGVSARTLNRNFALYGTTPMKWVWEKRLELAHDAIKRGTMANVTQVAFAHGFKDAAHFSRAFSRKFGMTPSQVSAHR